MNQKLKYAPREIVDQLIDDNYLSIFEKDDTIEYIASIPENINNIDEESFYIEIGTSGNSQINYIPITFMNDKYSIPKKWIDNEIIDTKNIGTIYKSRNVMPFRFQISYKKIRPLIAGLNIGDQDASSGTLGAIVKLKTSEDYYILSNHHVLTGFKFEKDKLIEQPSMLISGQNNGVSNIVAQVEYGHFGEYVDVALARILYPVKSEHITTIGTESPTDIGIPKVGDRIYKIGASSRRKSGRIRSVNTYVRFQKNRTAEDKSILKKQLLLDNISEGGDSGSAIVREKDKVVVGLLFGGDEKKYSVANNIQYIFKTIPKHYKNLHDIQFEKFI